jgi:type-F conjugative transfer system secretin TraK
MTIGCCHNLFLFKSSLIVLCLMAVCLPAVQASQTIVLAENKRLEAKICAGSMNRLAVANDRITQIFGDEGTFESQNDDNLGQVFLKPTPENGEKSLSLTLITEQGVTQDLTLHPTAASATTLILKHSSAKQNPSSAPTPDLPLHPSLERVSQQGADPADRVLGLLRQAVQNRLPAGEGDVPVRPNPEGYAVSVEQVLSAESYTVLVLKAKNTLTTQRDVLEQAFYRPGDLAIHVQERVLLPQASTLIYVVKPL